jgi:ATP synthase (C/AC39) subunit
MFIRALLRDMPAGVPSDCLLARIKGRRSFLVCDWDILLLDRQPLATLSAAPWRQEPSGAGDWALRALQQEYFWAFLRMDEQMRHSTAPFFWLAEVRTLAVCLRLLSGEAANLDRLLQSSLLANNIRKTLQEADGCASAVAGLAALLAGHDPRFIGVVDAYHRGGTGALETALYEISLRCLTSVPLHPEMRCHVALMIDSRNLSAVAKHLRWRLDTLPPLLEGGSLPLPQLAEMFQRRDSAGLLHLAMRLGGKAAFGETADLERVLYQARARVMHRLARQAGGVGTIIEYLWRCGNEAANIGLLERMETAGSEHVAAELRR